MNKYLEIIMNSFDELTTEEVMEQLLLVKDVDELTEFVNIAVVLDNRKDLIKAMFTEYERLNTL